MLSKGQLKLGDGVQLLSASPSFSTRWTEDCQPGVVVDEQDANFVCHCSAFYSWPLLVSFLCRMS
jgi:hypothetical protein